MILTNNWILLKNTVDVIFLSFIYEIKNLFIFIVFIIAFSFCREMLVFNF